MNVGYAILFTVCGALASGIFVGNFKFSEPAPITVNSEKEKEIVLENMDTGQVGPCKVYLINNSPSSFSHPVTTVICPKEYNVATATLY